VVEVNRPDRAARRRHGKSDPVDAEAAAKAVQAADVVIVPKADDGRVEMIRSLRGARQTAMRAPTRRSMRSKPCWSPLPRAPRAARGLSTLRLVRAASMLEPGPSSSPLAAAMLALGILADRYQALSAEIGSLTTELNRLTAAAAPKRMALSGIGADSAGALLVAAGDNPGRLRNDACFSMLCGASPIQASSGKTTRHRLM
jgi:transposase